VCQCAVAILGDGRRAKVDALDACAQHHLIGFWPTVMSCPFLATYKCSTPEYKCFLVALLNDLCNILCTILCKPSKLTCLPFLPQPLLTDLTSLQTSSGTVEIGCAAFLTWSLLRVVVSFARTCMPCRKNILHITRYMTNNRETDRPENDEPSSGNGSKFCSLFVIFTTSVEAFERPAIAGCRQDSGRIARLKDLNEDRATSMADDCAAHDTEPWRAHIQWLGGWLRSHPTSDANLLLLRGLVSIG